MSKYESFYKTTQTIAQLREIQITRRLKFLSDQQQKRNDQYSFLRDLKNFTPNKSSNERPKNDSQSAKIVINDQFKNILMMSEWMMAQPDDLEDYLLIPLPKGNRVSVSVGDYGKKTELHLKNGQHILDVKTNLPAHSILDCIYSKSNKVIYILDVLMYAGRDFVNCESAFRRFWIESKLMEDKIRCYDEGMQLKILLDFDFINPHSVHECFQKYPMFDDGGKLDGFLFYHKKSSYTYGETPLVLWLFPFMIDEVLRMYPINPLYKNQRPQDYTNYLDYIKKFNEKQNKKKGKPVEKVETAVDFTKDLKEDEMLKL